MSNNMLISAIILAIGMVGSAYILVSPDKKVAESDRVLQVVAEGKVTAVPDTVTIYAGVEVLGIETQDAAYAVMNLSAADVQRVLEEAGVPKNHIQTSGLSVSRNYDWTESGRLDAGYRASQSYTIRLDKMGVEAVNAIVDGLVTVDNISVHNVDYELKNTEDVYREARKMALEKANQKAVEMAQAAGVTLGKVQQIAENTNAYAMPFAQNYRSMDMAVEMANAQGASIAMGQMEYTATVNVTYLIK